MGRAVRTATPIRGNHLGWLKFVAFSNSFTFYQYDRFSLSFGLYFVMSPECWVACTGVVDHTQQGYCH